MLGSAVILIINMDIDTFGTVALFIALPVLGASDDFSVIVVIAVELDVDDVRGQLPVAEDLDRVAGDAPVTIKRLIHDRDMNVALRIEILDDRIDRHLHKAGDKLRSGKIHRELQFAHAVFLYGKLGRPLREGIIILFAVHLGDAYARF